MHLYITYKAVNGRYTSFNLECNYRRDAYKAVVNKPDFKSLYSIVRLKNKPVTYSNYNGCHDDNLTRVKY